MLHMIRRFEDLDGARLMEVYAEGNSENAESFYPDLSDRAEGIRRVELDFLDFLKERFYARPDPIYWILEEDGLWVSALRTNQPEPGLYYLEALETRPDCRKQGCAYRLLSRVLDVLKESGPFRLCDCVDKDNAASLRTHAKCGFRITAEEGFSHLSGDTNPRSYSLEYSCQADSQMRWKAEYGSLIAGKAIFDCD